MDFLSRWSIGRVAVVRCAILNRDDVLQWRHEEVADFWGAMQRVHEWSKLFDDTRVLSAGDPMWMLAQASCCTRRLVAGRSWSCQRQRVQVRCSVAALTLIKQFWQKTSSVPEATSRRRLSMPLLRKSNMMPTLGTRVREFHFCCEVNHGPRYILRIVRFFFVKFELREYVVRRSDGGHGSCWKQSWA